MAQTFITLNLDPDDAGNAARQLQVLQQGALRIAAEATQAINQVGPLQNVNVSYGTQTVVACQANAAWFPSSRAGLSVVQV